MLPVFEPEVSITVVLIKEVSPVIINLEPKVTPGLIFIFSW